VIDCLQKRKINFSYYDPLVPYLKWGHFNLTSVKLDAATLKRFDCAVVLSDHSDVDYVLIRKNSRLIFDTRNVYKGIKDAKISRI
jgi:UDP-N-acetyl-D-glucosamine dehydrogenase